MLNRSKEVEISDATLCTKLASFEERTSKEFGRCTCNKGFEERKHLDCIEKGHKGNHVLETIMSVVDLLHILLTLVVAFVGKSNVTRFFYFTKVCQESFLSEKKPQRLQVYKSAKVHKEKLLNHHSLKYIYRTMKCYI